MDRRMIPAGAGPPGRPPLAGVRILDLTQVMAGPWCTQLLADLGADVVKIEAPAGGDQTRQSFGTGPGDNPAFRAVNRNKRSVAIDLKSAAGQQVLHRMAVAADVLVENFRPGVAERLHADAATLHRVNDRLVVTSLSGFGTTGDGSSELAGRPGFDLIAQAMTGLMSVTGLPGGDPVKTGVPITDLAAGMFAAIGILAALRNRDTTGRGDHVRTSLYQAGLAMLVWESAAYWATGVEPTPTGSGHRMLAPYQALRTRDSALVVAANNDKLWRLLLSTLGLTQLATDPRFLSNADRMTNKAELAHTLEARLITDDTDPWVGRLVSAGVPAAPVRTVGQALADPHTQALAMVGQVEHPVVGRHSVLGLPIQFGAGVRWPGRPSPALGEHSREVLREYGLQPDEIDELTANGVVR